ncbi:MAG: hypothetical protein AB7T37_06850 [Dehalococcoidia bacterium]
MTESTPVNHGQSPYEQWNSAIGRHYFGGRFSNRPVYLDVDDAELAAAAADAAISIRAGEKASEALARAVRPTLGDLTRGQGLFDDHYGRLIRWRMRGRAGTPPFLALLAFLCVVAEEMQASGSLAPTNYYGRFCQLAGIKTASRNRAGSQFRKDTPMFWDALELWLHDQEGRLGLPTAKAFDHRRYIGLPMSQVLIREHERLRLHDLFAELDFRPRQTLTSADMKRVLESAIGRGGLTGQFDRLWSAGSEMKDRLAGLACLELEAWDGSSQTEEEDGPTTRRTRLRMALATRSHPRPVALFSLVAVASPSVSEGRYHVGGSTDGRGRETFAATGGELELRPSEVSGWLSSVEQESIDFGACLEGKIEVLPTETVPGTACLYRSPRAVVVLAKDPDLGLFVENEHAELTTDSVVLVRERLAPRVAEVLQAAARPGFTMVESGRLPGVPRGWAVFRGVQVVRLPALVDKEYDLASLVPVTWSRLDFDGGFKLPGRNTWHSSAPPEVRATLVEGTSAELRVERDDGSYGARLPFIEAAVMTPGADTAIDGDYLAAVVVPGSKPSGDRVLASGAFRLRSADSPRELPSDSMGWFGHSLEGPTKGFAALSAVSTPSPPGCGVQGALVVGADAEPVAVTGIPSEPRSGENDADELYEPPATPTPTTTAPSASRGCLDGAHHWIIDPVATFSGYYRPHKGRCRGCGLRDTFPARPGGAHPGPHPTPQKRPSISAVKPPAFFPVDMLLDACCFARRDTWPAFNRLSDAADDAPWFASETWRTISSLGHLDVELDPGTLSPRSWAVAPAALVLSADGSYAFLAGFRSNALVEAFKEAVASLGAEREIQEWNDAPATYSVGGLTPAHLGQVARALGDRLHIMVGFEPAAALALASALPCLSELTGSLPAFPRPAGGRAERFDVPGARWEAATDTRAPGAYRFRPTFGPTTTAFFDGERWRRGDSGLVKYLAAASERQSLVAYRHGHLYVPLGARLPGLYERAAVLCSGYPPQKLTDGTICYNDVPELVASLIYQELTT